MRFVFFLSVFCCCCCCCCWGRNCLIFRFVSRLSFFFLDIGDMKVSQLPTVPWLFNDVIRLDATLKLGAKKNERSLAHHRRLIQSTNLGLESSQKKKLPETFNFFFIFFFFFCSAGSRLTSFVVLGSRTSSACAGQSAAGIGRRWRHSAWRHRGPH